MKYLWQIIRELEMKKKKKKKKKREELIAFIYLASYADFAIWLKMIPYSGVA